MSRRRKKTDAKDSPLDATPFVPKTDPTMSSDTNKVFGGKGREKSFKPKTPAVIDVHAMRQSQIIPGFGMSVPAFRLYESDSENTYIPLGITFGHFVPLGQSDTSEIYPQQGTMYAQRVIAQLRNMGYENDYTVANVRSYFQYVASLLQIQCFITELRTLVAFSHVHTSGPVTALSATSINGRLVAIHRRVSALLATLPFDPKWEQYYKAAFSATTLSDSPFGPIRMWAPKLLQPEVDYGNVSYPLQANVMCDLITNRLADMYNSSSFVELASVLGCIFKTRQELAQINSVPFGFNQASVNNLLNLAYFDGSTHEPTAADNETVKYFFRRKVVAEGMFTYAPDDSILTTPQSTVWAQKLSGLESSVDSLAIRNEGDCITIIDSSDRFNSFGRVWESSLAVTGGVGPGVSHVTTTFSAVSLGIADMMFN